MMHHRVLRNTSLNRCGQSFSCVPENVTGRGRWCETLNFSEDAARKFVRRTAIQRFFYRSLPGSNKVRKAGSFQALASSHCQYMANPSHTARLLALIELSAKRFPLGRQGCLSQLFYPRPGSLVRIPVRPAWCVGCRGMAGNDCVRRCGFVPAIVSNRHRWIKRCH